MKRLLSLILFIGSFSCAMDAPSTGEPAKKKQKYQIEHDNQTVEITQQGFNALKNQSVTIARMLKDADDDVSIPTGIAVNTIKRILPLLMLIEQKETHRLKGNLQNASLEDLISILKTANFLDSKTLLESCINQIASKELNNPKVLELLERELPTEISLMIGSELLKNNPQIAATILQQISIPCKTLTGHFGSVLALATTKDKIVSGSSDKTIKIWDMNTGDCLQTLSGHNGRVGSVIIFKDKIVSGSRGKTIGEMSIKIWNMNTGELLKTLYRGSSPFVITKNKIVSESSLHAGTIKIWDIKTGDCLNTFIAHFGSVLALATTGDKIISGSDDMTIKIWDSETGEHLKTLKEGYNWVNSVAIIKDKVVSASGVRTIKIWDINTANYLQTIM